jgi:multidrug efflux pump subunit AcrA (membrane-fusion protein)
MSSITQIKPKRTLNPYMLFLNKNRSQIKNVLIAVGVEPKVAAVVKAAGTQWRQMSTEEKQPYIDEANTLKDEAQAQANRLNAEAQAQAQAAVLVNTTPEPVSIPPVVHTKETLRTLHTDVVKICECYEVMVDELQETLNNYIDTDTKSQEQLADKQAEIDALQKRVQLEEKEKAETEINGAKLRLSSNATSEERKALHLLLKSEKLSIVAMLDDKEVDDLQLSM